MALLLNLCAVDFGSLPALFNADRASVSVALHVGRVVFATGALLISSNRPTNGAVCIFPCNECPHSSTRVVARSLDGNFVACFGILGREVIFYPPTILCHAISVGKWTCDSVDPVYSAPFFVRAVSSALCLCLGWEIERESLTPIRRVTV